MQIEFGKVLRNQRYHARVMRSRRHFTEKYFVLFDKQFDTKHTTPAKCVSYCARNFVCAMECEYRHGMWLP